MIFTGIMTNTNAGLIVCPFPDIDTSLDAHTFSPNGLEVAFKLVIKGPGIVVTYMPMYPWDFH